MLHKHRSILLLLTCLLCLLVFVPETSSATQANSAGSPDAALEAVQSADAAADFEEVEMADLMRSNGKIYVVVGVLAIVLLGVLVYLGSIDRKISKLEREVEANL